VRYVECRSCESTMVVVIWGLVRSIRLPGSIGDRLDRHCGGTAPKLAAVPALSVPAVLCRRNLCGRLDGLDDHLAAIVVSHAV
jgi:hypothetical protein